MHSHTHWGVQMRLHILAIVYKGPPPRLLRTTLYLLLEPGLIGRQNETHGAIRPPCGTKESPTAKAS